MRPSLANTPSISCLTTTCVETGFSDHPEHEDTPAHRPTITTTVTLGDSVT